MTISFTIDLDIPDVEIISIKLDRKGNRIIKVKSTKNGCSCRICGKNITKYHGLDREITLRHLSILGVDTYIVICLPRYRCYDCETWPTTTQQTDWFIRRSPHTLVYEHQILVNLIGSTIEDVSSKEGIGVDAVKGIINRHIENEIDWDILNRLEQLGIDEISLKKGHKDFVTIVTSRANGVVTLLAVLKDRKKDTLIEFLEKIPKNLKLTVKSVCCDLYDGFINAAKKVFSKKVKIVADRFHVAKLYRNGLNTLRKQELKRLGEELSKNEYKELKGSMWALRKSQKNLTSEDKKLLQKLFDYSPLLKEAYDLQSNLTDIFNMKISRSGGKRRIQNWKKRVLESGTKCFNSFLSTLDSWIDEISNYFVARESSGFVEGLNNKIKVIKRRCYGIINSSNLFQRIVLDISKDDIIAQNSNT